MMRTLRFKVLAVVCGIVGIGLGGILAVGCWLTGTAPHPKAPAVSLSAFRVSPVPQRNHVAVFLDREIPAELFRLLAGAERRIQIDYFLLSGQVGWRIAQVLDERAAHGVDVRVMLDSKLGLGGPLAAGTARVVADLQAHGVPIRLYPIHLFGPAPNRLQDRIHIDHDKLIAIDGRTAFIGSMNLHDRAMTNHDLMLRVEGPTAVEVSAMLDAEWPYGTPLGGAAQPAAQPPAGLPASLSPGDSLMRLTETAPQEKTTKPLLLAAIRQAKRLDIAMYLFAEPDLLAAVCDAARRGVPVRAILDPRITSTAKYGAIARIVPDGMPNLLAARMLVAAGGQVKWFIPTGPDQESHMKLVLIDGRMVIAGSTNWTINSFVRWRDTSFTLEGPPVARFATMFEQDWQTARPFEPLTMKQRLVATAVEAMNRRDWGFW